MALTTIVSVIFAAIFLPQLWSLVKNYREARKVGIPIVVTPIVTLHPLSFLLGPFLFPLMKKLPGPFPQWAKYGNHFWMIGDGYRTHEQLGPVFAVVSPGDTSLFISDHVAGEKLLSRTKEFIKPPVIYSSIEVYGPNVDTVNGDTWNRHRRITTPPFNERNSDLVWQESLRQAQGVLQKWVENSETGGADTKKDTMKVALHVLSSAGFGQGHDFQGGVTKLSPGHEMTYAGSLATILGDVLATFTVSQLPFSLGFVPRFRIAEKALAEFKKYMVEMVDEERRLISERGPKDNLMSVLVRSADASKESGGARNSLSDEEIFGNLFIWNLAGHDTTAGALSYAITLLSIHPDVQDWIREEINSVFKDIPVDEWKYEEAFPKLKRCLALMYETLRLNLPAPSMPKQTGDTPQTLRINEKEYEIPARWHVTLNLIAVHADPRSWGDDALVWNPRRFIKPGTGANDAEDLVVPSPASAFVPWASGPRVCPGKKFAQVEFVAVIACLFRAHKLRPARLQGESVAETRARVLDVVADSSVTKSVTLAMNHPERVRFVWEKV